MGAQLYGPESGGLYTTVASFLVVAWSEYFDPPPQREPLTPGEWSDGLGLLDATATGMRLAHAALPPTMAEAIAKGIPVNHPRGVDEVDYQAAREFVARCAAEGCGASGSY